MYSSELKTTNIHIKNRWTRHQIVQTLWRPHRDTLIRKQFGGIPSHTLTQRWSFRIQNFRGSLGHVRDHRGARPTHSNAVLHSNMTKKLNNVLIRMEIQKHPEQKSFKKTCKYVHQYDVWRTHLGRKPTWWRASLRSGAECPKNTRVNSGRFP